MGGVEAENPEAREYWIRKAFQNFRGELHVA